MDQLSQQLATPVRRPLVERKFRLRGCIEYHQRPRWHGGWDLITQDARTAIWSQPKDGMAYFVVEGEDANYNVAELLRVSGQDYAYASWGVYSYSPSVGFSGTTTLRPIMYALEIWTTCEKIAVLVDGRIDRRPLTEAEKGFYVREHSI